jgi:hypothetical protein
MGHPRVGLCGPKQFPRLQARRPGLGPGSQESAQFRSACALPGSRARAGHGRSTPPLRVCTHTFGESARSLGAGTHCFGETTLCFGPCAGGALDRSAQALAGAAPTRSARVQAPGVIRTDSSAVHDSPGTRQPPSRTCASSVRSSLWRFRRVSAPTRSEHARRPTSRVLGPNRSAGYLFRHARLLPQFTDLMSRTLPRIRRPPASPHRPSIARTRASHSHARSKSARRSRF